MNASYDDENDKNMSRYGTVNKNRGSKNSHHHSSDTGQVLKQLKVRQFMLLGK